jgi:lysophospholipase L1-like esterase
MSTHLTLFIVFVIILFLMAYRPNKKKTILFFGDSITQQASNIDGFVVLINRYIFGKGLHQKYHCINKGQSGNRIYDLYLRLEEDVLAKSPNVVVMMIGINDVWGKQKSGTGLEIVKFEQFYRAILVKLLAANISVIICTPTVIGELQNNANLDDNDLNEYSKLIAKMAAEYKIELCDTRTAFVKRIHDSNYENVAEGFLTTDGVHLNTQGNEVVGNLLWYYLEKIVK